MTKFILTISMLAFALNLFSQDNPATDTNQLQLKFLKPRSGKM